MSDETELFCICAQSVQPSFFSPFGTALRLPMAALAASLNYRRQAHGFIWGKLSIPF
jgi:hypothetical protein